MERFLTSQQTFDCSNFKDISDPKVLNLQRLKLIQIDITKIKLPNIRNLEYFDFQVHRSSFRKFE